MSTGVEAKTYKLIVLDQNMQSMSKFKQIIGCGTRIDDRYNKRWFTILDFKKATELLPMKILMVSCCRQWCTRPKR
jgi:type I restriction enzyme R subunit